MAITLRRGSIIREAPHHLLDHDNNTIMTKIKSPQLGCSIAITLRRGPITKNAAHLLPATTL